MAQKLDILAFSVHPDDVELSCCGTVIKHIKLGHKVGVVDLTGGELGTRGSREIRAKEAQAAKEYLNLSIRENLQMRDGFFRYNDENLLKLITIIRKYQPEIVLANAKTDRHPDHGRAAKLCSDACFYSGLRKIKTQDAGHAQDPWRPKAVYHYIQDYNLKPDFVVDISEYQNQKMEAIKMYKSQFFNPDSDEPETPLSAQSFLDFIEAKARVFGRHIGADFGEGFQVNRYIGVDNLFDLK